MTLQPDIFVHPYSNEQYNSLIGKFEKVCPESIEYFLEKTTEHFSSFGNDKILNDEYIKIVIDKLYETKPYDCTEIYLHSVFFEIVLPFKYMPIRDLLSLLSDIKMT